ncbi:MAG: 1-acyl-sn-glycerol-3-phosphate acyltransferase [Bacteroidota bacterium]|jgi:1-acyl-sn-glycerol-3-phosphate acyltransferase|nr:1-acyl-sn-glycerol-3-phosphate acyltransferase [Cytophagales bacterium]
MGTIKTCYGVGKMMQRFFFSALRIYVWAALHIFFRRIKVSGKREVPRGAVLFTPNHQNAFMDALLVVCSSGRYTHFLARADIFKKAWAKMLLRWINMIPIYRTRDGWQSLTQNQKTFEACAHLLQQEEAVVIFPEGNHGSARRLRPLSKGFTRVAFEALRTDPNLPLYIVPVGLNYSSPTAARGDVHIVYGAALNVNQFFKMGEQQGAQKLREVLSGALKSIITHLPEEKDLLQEEWRGKPVDFLQPQKVNAWIAQPTLPLPLQPSTPDLFGAMLRMPLFPLILLWRRWDAKIKDRVFVASLKFVFAWLVATVCVILLLTTLLIWLV